MAILKWNKKINYNNVMVEMRYKGYLFIMTTVSNVVHSTVKSRILYSFKIHINWYKQIVSHTFS